MIPLMAGDALHQPMLRVMAEAHPQDSRGGSGAVLYAVFAGDRDATERGPFLGLVTEREIAQHPRRIFADLLTSRQPTPVAMDTLLDEVLRQMDKEGVDALPVFDASGIFVGVVTRTSLLAALLERERLLLDESQRRRSTTEGDLTSALSLLTATLEATGDGILVVDTTGKITSFNRKFVEMWRIPEAVIASQDDNQALAFVLEQLENPEAFLQKVRDLYAQPDLESFDVIPIKDGRVFERHSQPQRIGGVSVGRVWSFYDVTERMRAVDALRQSERRIRAIMDNAADGIITINDRGIVESFNPAAERIFGYPAAEVVGRTVNILMPEPYRSEYDAYLNRYATTGTGHVIGIGLREVVGQRKDGTIFPMELAIGEMWLDRRRFFIGTVRDITERKQAQDRLNHLAYHDVLTELPNRLLFNDRFAQTAINASRHNRVVAMMFLDLDRFKTINDTLGHEVGDLLLKVVADRLIGCVRDGDTVARLGGDEYAILLADMAQAQDTALVAQKILDGFVKPFRVGSHELYTSASIGITLFPTDDTHIENLLKNADAAMYRAKDRGRSNYQFYTADMNAKAVERLTLETHLRHALERGELLLHYQPQVDLKTGRIIGTEALVRWQRPEAGLISPLDFIPLAEETGLIVPIGEWVLRAACVQAKAWHSAGLSPLPISVNVSAHQFRHQAFIETVQRVLGDTGLRPDLLELEITESVAMEHAKTTIERLDELHAMGVRLSIDDFGTGYSSLSYLTRFPLHTLKIDRAFINNVTTDPAHSAIASAIILLAHNLNLRVVGEGVETEAQAAFLRAHRCDAMQGYLFSRPVAEPDMSSMLARGRRWAPITPP